MLSVNNVDKKLSVESFTHWVWVAGVTPSVGYDSLLQPVDKVDFTYSHTGDSLFNILTGQKTEDGINYWPNRDVANKETYLPWTGTSDTVQDSNSPYNGRHLSATSLVWYWHAYDYDPSQNAVQNPSATTRYIDGSP